MPETGRRILFAMPTVVFFTQPGCLPCELLKVYLEATGTVFEERDISTDTVARREMSERHGSNETPTLVVMSGEIREVIIGFDPARLDRLLTPAPSSDAVIEP
jgi:glutaredoxin